MKKLLLSFLIAGTAFIMNSCRETTEEKTQDALEAIGEDMEDNAKRTGKEIEEGAEKIEQAIEEEIHDTDDQN